tara:strand:+ start:139 stop:351 length:213 start_codon:yes stop_codon:yes gene_type:complete
MEYQEVTVTLIAQAIELTVLGMGIVFMLLTMLVLCTKLMTRILEVDPAEPSPDEMAAIAAAFKIHLERGR